MNSIDDADQSFQGVITLDFLVDLIADVIFWELLMVFMILNNVFFVVVSVVLVEELLLVFFVVKRDVMVFDWVFWLGFVGVEVHEFFKIFLKTLWVFKLIISPKVMAEIEKPIKNDQ